MKKFSIFITLVLFACFTAAASAQDMTRVKCDRYTMNVPSQNVKCYQTDDNIPVGEEASPEEVAKAQTANTTIYFSDYERTSSTVPPQVIFYDFNDLGQTSFELMERAFTLSDMIENLNSGFSDLAEDYEETPFLPYQVEERQVWALPKAINFDGGTGIRTIAVFEDVISAGASGSNLYYSFQAVSTDGETYVSAVFPLQCPSIQGQRSKDVNWEALGDKDFNPSLDELDYYMQSIVME